jgi:hypothetical protein
MDNLEKLIQMATIEHMYSMLQKMKTDNSTNFKESIISDENNLTENNSLISSILNEIKSLKTEINHHTEKVSRRIDGEILQLTQTIKYMSDKTEQLENELNAIKNNTNNNSKFLCQQLRGQQLLTSYPGFSIGTPLIDGQTWMYVNNQTENLDEANVKLKIEEKEQHGIGTVAIIGEEDITNNGSEEQSEELEEEEESEEEEDEEELEEESEEDDDELEEEAKIGDVHPGLMTCSTIQLSTSIETTQTKETVEEVSEEDVSEDEVGTDNEKEYLEEVTNKTEITQPTDKTEEEEEVEEDEKEEEEEEEEEEEVFEIEIDDVTYFATHEENGILYEITSDGDVGKKIGIIKDGEPILN